MKKYIQVMRCVKWWIEDRPSRVSWLLLYHGQSSSIPPCYVPQAKLVGRAIH